MKKVTLILAATAAAVCILPMTACNSKQEKENSKYVITAAYDQEKRSLSGTADFTYYNSTDNEISDLSFNLWGNAYRKDAQYKPVSDADAAKAYYAGKDYGEQTVEKVEGCASWEVGGEDKNILSVTLSEPLYPDQKVTVSITYTLSLAKINHRTGVTENCVNLGNFYPVLCAYTAEGFAETPYYSCGDPFVSECADYDVTLTMPSGYTAATSGKEVSKVKSGDDTTCRYELKNARDFAAVLSDKFKTVTRSAAGCQVTLYYCGETAPEKQLNAACESMEYFSRTYGDYAYPTLSVVFTGLTMSGMEYPALTMISDSLDESGAVYTIAHENAHQWWYAMVGNDQVNCSWQDEGLAEYSTLCFFETHPEYGFTRTGMLGSAVKAYRSYYSVYNQIFGKVDTTMTRSLKDYASDYEYANVAYNKGLMLFETLRTSMGDRKFNEALSNYCKQYKFKIASKEALIACFTALHDVEGVFTSYLDGKAVI